jgi:hypothetical protein
MRRLISTLAVLAALALAMSTLGGGVLAQDETAAEHPIVGTWLVDPAPEAGMEPDQFNVFLPGGGVILLESQGTAAGAWQATGERSADVTVWLHGNDPEGGFVGFMKIRANLEVAEDGESLSGTYTIEAPSRLGEAFGLPAGELGPGDVTGQRVAVEPMGEPVAPIPPSDGQDEQPGGASPAPDASPDADGSPLPEASPAG